MFLQGSYTQMSIVRQPRTTVFQNNYVAYIAYCVTDNDYTKQCSKHSNKKEKPHV